MTKRVTLAQVRAARTAAKKAEGQGQEALKRAVNAYQIMVRTYSKQQADQAHDDECRSEMRWQARMAGDMEA